MEQGLIFANLSVPWDPPKIMKASFSPQQGFRIVRVESANHPEAWLLEAYPWLKKITTPKICKSAFH